MQLKASLDGTEGLDTLLGFKLNRDKCEFAGSNKRAMDWIPKIFPTWPAPLSTFKLLGLTYTLPGMRAPTIPPASRERFKRRCHGVRLVFRLRFRRERLVRSLAVSVVAWAGVVAAPVPGVSDSFARAVQGYCPKGASRYLRWNTLISPRLHTDYFRDSAAIRLLLWHHRRIAAPARWDPGFLPQAPTEWAPALACWIKKRGWAVDENEATVSRNDWVGQTRTLRLGYHGDATIQDWILGGWQQALGIAASCKVCLDGEDRFGSSLPKRS